MKRYLLMGSSAQEDNGIGRRTLIKTSRESVPFLWQAPPAGISGLPLQLEIIQHGRRAVCAQLEFLQYFVDAFAVENGLVYCAWSASRAQCIFDNLQFVAGVR